MVPYMLILLACKNGRVRWMVLHRHNDITLQNDAVSVPRFIGTVIHATNVQHHLLLGIRQYNVPCLQTVYTFWP